MEREDPATEDEDSEKCADDSDPNKDFGTLLDYPEKEEGKAHCEYAAEDDWKPGTHYISEYLESKVQAEVLEDVFVNSFYFLVSDVA